MTATRAEGVEAKSTPRVLFFSRSGCDASVKALSYLRTLGFEITPIISNGRAESLPEQVNHWTGEYIFCFRSLFVLPKRLIDRASVAAVNFHPAPVEYPGSGCLNFALYDHAERYGVTAHIMNEKVDNGAVVECRRFPILPGDTVDTLLERTHMKLLDLFYDVVGDLASGGKAALDRKLENSASERWNGEARKMKDFDRLQTISVEVDESELRRIIRATYTAKWPPVIKLHGYEFVLRSPNKIG